MVNYIWVTNRKEFIHNYPNAPEEVGFLKNAHRHIFLFQTYLQVKHDNRDVEFIRFKREIDDILAKWDLDRENLSCEMMANKLYEIISVKYTERDIKIEVSEDGENGVEYSYSANHKV